MTAGGDALHSFLVEGVRNYINTRNAVTGFGQQSLNAARRMKAKIIAVGAAKHLVDLGFEGDIDRVFRFLDDRVEDDEPGAVFQYAQHFPDHALGVAKVVQAERDKGAVE